MINTWAELFTTVKKWFDTPLKWERKVEERFVRTTKLDPHILDIIHRYNGPHHPEYSDKYIESLIFRRNQGDYLTSDELYILSTVQPRRG